MALFSPELNPTVKLLPKPAKLAAGYDYAMDDIYGIRRRNFGLAATLPAISGLVRENERADMLGVSTSMWSQLKNPAYRIGDDLARKIEAALSLEPGWLDNPQEGEFFSSRNSRNVGITPDTLRSVLQITQATVEAMGLPFVAAEQAEVILNACRVWAASRGSEATKASRVTMGIMDGLRGS